MTPDTATAAAGPTLRVAEDLALPLRAQTETFAFLAVRGAGKTHNASVLAEEFAKAGLPFVVLDPVGVWHGLRSSADGQGPGFPVTILGGEHGDLALEATSGVVVADLVVEQRASLILDLSLFGEAEMARFVAAFLGRLYMRNREPLHVFVDEADEFAPQQPYGDQASMLGALQRVVKRGRARGLGVTLISQRAADVNKKVLSQAEVLVAQRTTGSHDLKAIDAWIQSRTTAAQAREILASLPSLETGVGWVCSAHWLRSFRRVRFRRRETFDSSRTPEPGEQRREPRVLAPVDLDALRARMAETIAPAKADDAKALRARVRDLEEQLAAAAAAATPVPAPVVERVEVPVVGDQAIEDLRGLVEQFLAGAERASAAAVGISEQLARVGCAAATSPAASTSPRPRPARAAAGPRAAPPADLRADPAPTSGPGAAAREALPPRRRRILDAVRWLNVAGVAEPSRIQVALIADTTAKSSTFEKDVSALRSGGLISFPSASACALTAAGGALAAAPKRISTADLHQALERKLPPRRWRIVAAAIAAHPGQLSREDLAAAAETTAVSSTFEKDVSGLRSAGLVTFPAPGRVAAAAVLFLRT